MLISIVSLYEHFPYIFDDFEYPAEMNRELIINTIVKTNAELSLVYSDPPMLKTLIGIWSKSHKPIWERLYALETIEYNPIDNYNRIENRVVQRGGQRQGEGQTQNYTYGYNEKERNHHDDTDSQVQERYNDGESHDITAHGNIGVTTTQRMMEQELEVRPKLNIYQYIAEAFKNEFCVMVY